MDVGLRSVLDVARDEWRATGILSLTTRAHIYESLGPAGNPLADRRRGVLGLAAARHVATVWRAAWVAAADWNDAELTDSASYTGCGPASVEQLIAVAEATLNGRMAYGDASLVSVGFYEEGYTAEALENLSATHGMRTIGARAHATFETAYRALILVLDGYHPREEVEADRRVATAEAGVTYQPLLESPHAALFRPTWLTDGDPAEPAARAVTEQTPSTTSAAFWRWWVDKAVPAAAIWTPVSEHAISAMEPVVVTALERVIDLAGDFAGAAEANGRPEDTRWARQIRDNCRALRGLWRAGILSPKEEVLFWVPPGLDWANGTSLRRALEDLTSVWPPAGLDT